MSAEPDVAQPGLQPLSGEASGSGTGGRTRLEANPAQLASLDRLGYRLWPAPAGTDALAHALLAGAGGSLSERVYGAGYEDLSPASIRKLLADAFVKNLAGWNVTQPQAQEILVALAMGDSSHALTQELLPEIVSAALDRPVVVLDGEGQLESRAGDGEKPVVLVRVEDSIGAPGRVEYVAAIPAPELSDAMPPPAVSLPIPAGRYLPGPNDGPQHLYAALELPRYGSWRAVAAHLNQDSGTVPTLGGELDPAAFHKQLLADGIADTEDVILMFCAAAAGDVAASFAGRLNVLRRASAVAAGMKPGRVLAADRSVLHEPGRLVRTRALVVKSGKVRLTDGNWWLLGDGEPTPHGSDLAAALLALGQEPVGEQARGPVRHTEMVEWALTRAQIEAARAQDLVRQHGLRPLFAPSPGQRALMRQLGTTGELRPVDVPEGPGVLFAGLIEVAEPYLRARQPMPARGAAAVPPALPGGQALTQAALREWVADYIDATYPRESLAFQRFGTGMRADGLAAAIRAGDWGQVAGEREGKAVAVLTAEALGLSMTVLHVDGTLSFVGDPRSPAVHLLHNPAVLGRYRVLATPGARQLADPAALAGPDQRLIAFPEAQQPPDDPGLASARDQAREDDNHAVNYAGRAAYQASRQKAIEEHIEAAAQLGQLELLLAEAMPGDQERRHGVRPGARRHAPTVQQCHTR